MHADEMKSFKTLFLIFNVLQLCFFLYTTIPYFIRAETMKFLICCSQYKKFLAVLQQLDAVFVLATRYIWSNGAGWQFHMLNHGDR